MLDDIPMDNCDTTGDLYEYMPTNIASAGTNGTSDGTSVRPRTLAGTSELPCALVRPADEVVRISQHTYLRDRTTIVKAAIGPESAANNDP